MAAVVAERRAVAGARDGGRRMGTPRSEIVPKAGLQVGILLGDVGRGHRAALLLSERGDRIHDLIELRGGNPAMEPDVRILGGGGSLHEPASLLDKALDFRRGFFGEID